LICGASEAISQYLIYSACGPFQRICSVDERDDGKQQQCAKYEREVRLLQGHFNKRKTRTGMIREPNYLLPDIKLPAASACSRALFIIMCPAAAQAEIVDIDPFSKLCTQKGVF
jgi:hypothetical protein